MLTPAETPCSRRASEPYLELQVVGDRGPLPEPDDELPLGYRIGDYLLESELGRGGMGVVYGAYDPVRKRRFAIKVLSRSVSCLPHATERFLQEAACSERIAHHGVAKVFSWGRTLDGRLYFVMEEVGGHSLARWMEERTLSLGDKLEVLAQLCDILSTAHAAGVVHRDIKPENVHLLHDGGQWRVKLLDFGLAKLQESPTVPRMTGLGIMMGTPEYVSPEQARGGDVDHRADIYSLGVVAYELILGRMPFRAEYPVEVLAMHVSQPPPPPEHSWPDIPPRLARTLEAMLHKRPDRRPSLATLWNELREISAGLGLRFAEGSRVGRVAVPCAEPEDRVSELPTIPIRIARQHDHRGLWCALLLTGVAAASVLVRVLVH